MNRSKPWLGNWDSNPDRRLQRPKSFRDSRADHYTIPQKLVPTAGFEPAKFWFLAKHVCQFHHVGIEIKSLLGSHAPTNIRKCTPLVLGTYVCDILHAFSFSATIEHMPSTSAPSFSCWFKLILQTNARGRFERPPETEFYRLSQL